MKNLLFLAFLFWNIISAFSQFNLKAEDATRYKEKPLLVLLTGNKGIDSLMREAVAKKWRFNNSIQFVTKAQGREMVTNEPNTYLRMSFLMISGVVETYTKWGGGVSMYTGSQDFGDMFQLGFNEDDEKKQYRIPLQSNYAVSKWLIMEGIQRGCEEFDEIENLGSYTKLFYSIKDRDIAEVKDKVLLIPVEYVKHIEDTAKLGEIYPYFVNFVPIETIYEKIENSDPNFVYVVVVEIDVNLFYKYLCTTENSRVISKDISLVQQVNPEYVTDRRKYISLSDMKNLSKKK